MSNVLDFQAAAREKFNEEFKQRASKREGYEGSDSAMIWEWEAMLKELGWTVVLDDRSLPEFYTYFNYSDKILRSHNPKAQHTRKSLQYGLTQMFGGALGCELVWWEELVEEQYKYEREDGSFYYAMGLKTRDMELGEPLPVNTKPGVNDGHCIPV